MGQLDQLAKLLFAEETATATGGAAAWEAPGEIGLSDVRLDGVLVVRRGQMLTRLAGPWAYAAAHDEVILEIKMPGDHLDFATLTRAELRRQARQVQRVESPEHPFGEEEPLWVLAPHVPQMLATRRTLTCLEPGCYQVDPYPYSFLWLAANELPLREDLIPFLMARSGKSLDDFGRWVFRRRPRSWVLRMVQTLPMSTVTREEMLRYIPITDDPEIRARQRHVAKVLLDMDPELQEEVQHETRLDDARSAVRRVLARRGLPLSAEEQARIDACVDLTVLYRWHEQAVVATSAAEAMH